LRAEGCGLRAVDYECGIHGYWFGAY